MNGTIPKNWGEATLNELLLTLETGSRPKGGVGHISEGIPSLGGEHLTYEGKFYFDNLKYIPIDFAKTLTKGKIAIGDVLIVKDGATTGKCVRVSEGFPYQDAYVNEHVFLCRFWPVLDSRFFAYFLRSEDGQKRILSNFRGAAQGGIIREFASNTVVPVAPIPEQNLISKKLTFLLQKVDTCQEHLDRVPQIIEHFRQSVLAEAVSGRLTEEWREENGYERQTEIYKIGEVGEIVTGSTPTKKNKEYYGGEIPFYKPTELNAGYYVFNSTEHLSELGAERARMLPERTVLVTCIGATIGKVGFSRKVGATNQQINSVISDENLVLPEFLYFWFSSPIGQSSVISNASATTLPILNKSRFSELELELPSLSEQHEIVCRAEKLFAYADHLEARYQGGKDHVELLTPSLLAKAFRGELVEQGPNDEPASVLLERIRAEREAAKEKKPKRITKTRKPRRKMTEKSLKEVIQSLPEDYFSFDELRENVPGDYEQLKSILFKLLGESEPIIEQIFDPDAQAMRFVRRG